MKFYIIAGEASGDLHASNLIRELKKLDPNAMFRCWGGDLMAAQGAEIVRDYRDLAFMGFFEVLSHLNTIRKNIWFCKSDILQYRPDVLILVDYPGFNLRVAGFAHDHGIRVFYYISPQLWAWRSSRVKIIKRNIDQMFVILPFEKEFYSAFDYKVNFIGHPLLDVINEETVYPDRTPFLNRNNLPDKPLIALLPGSRKQEIKMMLKIMLKVVNNFPDYQFVIAGAPSMNNNFYSDLISNTSVKIVSGQTYDLLHHSAAALVTSGTATLETALLKVPQIVCYKGSFFSYLLARMVIKVKYISLVNLIIGKKLVSELIQNELNVSNLTNELSGILKAERKEEIYTGYAELNEKLGGKGASAKAANLMIQYINQK